MALAGRKQKKNNTQQSTSVDKKEKYTKEYL